MATENALNTPIEIKAAPAGGLAGFLRDCARELEGLDFKKVSVNYSDVEREVLENVARTKAFLLRERRKVLVGARLLFSITDGEVNVVDPLGVKGVEFIRHGRTAGLLKEYGLDDPYNACILTVITRLLSMGITDSMEIGKPLPENVLIFLQSPKTEEESVKSSVEVVMGAVSRFKTLSPEDLADFTEKYRSIATRLAGCGIQRHRLTADRILTTIQQEAVRACVRIDVWMRVWRSFNEALEPAEALRSSQATRADPANGEIVAKLIQALKRQIVVLQQHLSNLDRLKATVAGGKLFYVDCLLLVIYVQENKKAIEDMYAMRSAWTEACKTALSIGSIQGVVNAIWPHATDIEAAISMAKPPAVTPH